MKRIFFFFVLLCCCAAGRTQQNLSELVEQIEKAQDTAFIRSDTLAVSAVTCNPATLAKFKKDSDYTYRKTRQSFSQKMLELVNRWLWKFFSTTMSSGAWRFIYILMIIVMIMTVAGIILVKRTRIFYWNRRQKPAYRIDDEDIENQNCDVLLARALDSGQYAEAIRWQFMKTLQTLQKRRLISFDAYKTVNEYIYEITEKVMQSKFKILSYSFVYYRYGQGKADETTFAKFRNISEEVIKMAGK